MFIILSHPHKDHVNLINEEMVTGKLFFGVWYGGGDWSDHKTRLTENIRKALNYDTYSLSPSNEKTINCDNLCFTLNDCVQGEKFTDSERKILNDVEITQISSGNINSQSTIVKIKMSELGMQSFLTEDAEDKTFEQIKKYKPSFFEKTGNYLSFVILPHHGARKNTSVDKLFEIFQPDILGISAGNCNQYDHPSEVLVENIRKQRYKGAFWKYFEIQGGPESMIVYQNKNERGAFIIDNETDKMPFVCTNLLGDIKIDKKGLKAKFSSIINENNVKYTIDLSERVDVKKVTFLNKFGNMQKALNENKEEVYYFCVEEKSKTLYYHAYPIISNNNIDGEVW